MKLYKSALTLLIVSCIVYSTNTLLRFFSPDISIKIGRMIYASTNTLTTITVYTLWIIFFYAFGKEFLSKNIGKFKLTVQLIIYTYMAVIVYLLIAIISIFNPMVDIGNWLIHVIIIIFWIQTLLIHILFLKIFTANLADEYPFQKSPLFLMMIGTFITFVLQTWILFDHFYEFFTQARLELFPQQAKEYIVLAIDSFSFLITAYFLFSIYRQFKPKRSN